MKNRDWKVLIIGGALSQPWDNILERALKLL